MDTAKLTIDGTIYELGYNFNDLCDAEEIAGCNLLDALTKFGNAATATQLRGLVYAMLVPQAGTPREPAALLQFCGTLIRIDTIGNIIVAIGEACSLAISEEYAQKFRDLMEQPLAPPPNTITDAGPPTPATQATSA